MSRDGKSGRAPTPSRSVTSDQPSIARASGGASPLEPDAEQSEAQRARSLLELAGAYVRQALALPEQVEALQSITASLLFENAMLRYQLDQLGRRVDALERRAGGSR